MARARRVNEKVCQTAEEFNACCDSFVEDIIPYYFQAVVSKIGLEALRRIVLRTPVDTGRARGNWQVSIGSPIETVVETMDPSGQQVIEDGTRIIADWSMSSPSIVSGVLTAVQKDLGAFPTVWISNNVPYILWLEDGSSKQAPAGMVGLTIQELEGMFQ